MFVGMENAMNPIVPISTALTSNPVSFCINLVSFCNLLYVLRTVFVKYIYKILFRLLVHYVVVYVCLSVSHTSNIELVNMLNQHCWIRKHYEAYMPHVRTFIHVYIHYIVHIPFFLFPFLSISSAVPFAAKSQPQILIGVDLLAMNFIELLLYYIRPFVWFSSLHYNHNIFRNRCLCHN